jgi:hypothetical protein
MSDNTYEANNYVPPTGPKTCPGCKGEGWQPRNDGIRVTCPMCCGTGVFIPPGTVTFKIVTPQPVYLVPGSSDDEEHPKCPGRSPKWPRPMPDYFNPWIDKGYYVGDDPRDWHGPPKVIC